MSNAKTLQFGFCRPNLSWLPRPNDYQPILDGIKESGAKAVQLNFREKYEPTYNQIAYCNKIGLPVNIEIMPLQTFMRDGESKRDGGGKLWDAYGISQIDLQKFKDIFDSWIAKFKADNLRVESIEVFNEINWADFNGDLGIVQGGAVVDERNFKKYDFAKKYFEGMAIYSKILAHIRQTLDREYSPESTKLPNPFIILGSFVKKSDTNWHAKINASLIDQDFHFKVLAGKIPAAKDVNNVFKNIDAYAVHIYPTQNELDVSKTSASKTVDKIVAKYLVPIFAVAPRNKLVCVTEFSYSSYMFRKHSDPQKARAEQTKIFLESLSKNASANINWGFIFHYCYDGDDNWGAIPKSKEPRKAILDIFKLNYPRSYRMKD